MSIQQNINQTLSLASLLFTQTGMAKEAIAAKGDAKALKGREAAGVSGIADIKKNLTRAELTEKSEMGKKLTPEESEYLKKEGTKKYGESEYKDIQDRFSQFKEDIYSAKVARANPRLQKYMGKDIVRQPELSSDIQKVEQYSRRAINALEARRKQHESSIAFRDQQIFNVGGK